MTQPNLPIITVSTDGSCLVNPGGAWGWAWVDHNANRFDAGGGPSGTNQIAELTGVLEAIKSNPGAAPLLIEADSQYAIKCASDWLPGWKAKGWRTAGGGQVKNLELVQAIDQAIIDRPGPVRFRWVRGHIGHHFNERADELAGIAARDWAAGRGEFNGVLFGAPDAATMPDAATIPDAATMPDAAAILASTPRAKHLKTDSATTSINKTAEPYLGSSEPLVSQILAPLAKKPKKPKSNQPTLFDE